jgi:hypothetical protein
MVLSDSHQTKLRQAGINARQETCVSAGVYMSTEAPVEIDKATCYHPKLFREGLDYWMEMHARSTVPAVRLLLLDRLEWVRRVFSYTASPVAIVMYAKHFMAEFAKEPHWVNIFRTDNSLMNRYLKTDARLGYDGELTQSLAPTYKRPSGAPAPPKGAGGGKRPKLTGGPKPDSSPKSKLFCNSRMDPTMGECTFHPCRFYHMCPIHAGENHTAKDTCPEAPGTRARLTPPRRRVAASRMVRQHHQPIYRAL